MTRFSRSLFYLSSLFLAFVSQEAQACRCKEHPPLDKTACLVYDFIGQVQLDSVSTCVAGFSTAWFKIKKLYQGQSLEKNELRFDCSSDCAMSLAKGEEWLVYATYYKYGKLSLDFCSRSRKKILEGDDYYASQNKMSYADELNQLKTLLGEKTIAQKESDSNAQRVLIQPTAYWKLWLLLISMVVLYVIFYLIKKMP
jgi:hypothetical protein